MGGWVDGWGADEMVAAGAGTLWRGEGRQRLVVCVFW